MAYEHPSAQGLAALQAAAEGHPGLPPVTRWNPAYCGDSGMRIGRDGTWFHQGEPIRRPGLVRLFSTILRKDEEGFMLVTPAEKLSIAVEDAPFLARADGGRGRRRTPAPRLHHQCRRYRGRRTGPCLRFTPDPASGAPIPYLHVRHGLEAKLARSVYYHLVERAVMRGGDLGVWSEGVFFVLGAMP